MSDAIPIDDAKRIATERRYPVVVIFGLTETGNRFSVASYGMTRKLCKLGGLFAEQITQAVFAGKVAPPETEPPDAPDLAAVQAERDKLQKFKDWVHKYLDDHGVPHHPPGPHGAEGCRIGDRMDWLMARLREAEARVAPRAPHPHEGF